MSYGNTQVILWVLQRKTWTLLRYITNSQYRRLWLQTNAAALRYLGTCFLFDPSYSMVWHQILINLNKFPSSIILNKLKTLSKKGMYLLI